MKNNISFGNIYFLSKLIKWCLGSLKEHTYTVSLRSDEQSFCRSSKNTCTYHLKYRMREGMLLFVKFICFQSCGTRKNTNFSIYQFSYCFNQCNAKRNISMTFCLRCSLNKKAHHSHSDMCLAYTQVNPLTSHKIKQKTNKYQTSPSPVHLHHAKLKSVKLHKPLLLKFNIYSTNKDIFMRFFI